MKSSDHEGVLWHPLFRFVGPPMNALIAAIEQDPADVTARFALADALDEAGREADSFLARSVAWKWRWAASADVGRFALADVRGSGAVPKTATFAYGDARLTLVWQADRYDTPEDPCWPERGDPYDVPPDGERLYVMVGDRLSQELPPVAVGDSLLTFAVAVANAGGWWTPLMPCISERC